MSLKPPPTARLVSALLLCLPMVGCIGWGDMFAAKHSLASDYYLMQGEGDPRSDLYLFAGHGSTSIAGPLYQIGWSNNFIIFTDKNWPEPWTVIDVIQHKTIKITEAQRAKDQQFSAIAVLNPDRAWIESDTR